MEAYYALDFVSLLLSKETPRQAELSMSQELKQHVPLGSIGVGRVQAQPESTEIIKDQDLVLKGWRLQSLNSAADALIKSAAKLESEIQQEVHYWEQILAIDGKSWSLCRMPKERHTLGVRFGFLEGNKPINSFKLRKVLTSLLQLRRSSETADWQPCVEGRKVRLFLIRDFSTQPPKP